MPQEAASDAIELSIVMPCLNESDTLGTCIEKAQRAMDHHGIAGEIVVADNGSTDASAAIAENLGARVVPVPTPGYGAALMGGIDAARGRYVIMGDADDSYDFLDIFKFVKALRDGWFASGDIGLRHAGGYLQLLDRKKNLIISGGFNIYPAEIEQTLRRHPQVRDAAVVGMPDDRLGEVAAALVVPCHPEGGAPVSDQELLSFCAARLARYKQPRIVRFVSTLPRNAMGKINTDVVRQAIARSTGSEE